MDSSSLKDKVVLITGAAAGIGAACARKFASFGCQVALMDIDEAGLFETSNQCEQFAQKNLVRAGDVRDGEFCKAFVADVVNKFGHLDILVNNAGVLNASSILKGTATPEKYREIFDVNVCAIVALTQLCVPHLLKSKGNIINIESSSAFVPDCERVFYCMSKAAVYCLTNCLAQELGVHGLRVNGINPSPVDTPLQEKCREKVFPHMSSEQYLEMAKNGSPFKAICPAESVANVAVFLASSDACFVTGQHLGVNVLAGWK